VGAGRAPEPLAEESAGLRGASPPAGTSPPAGATGTGEPPRAAEGQDRPVDSAAGPQGPDEPARPGDRTSEVSPGDWSRLRDVLGEEEDEDDLTFAPDEADVPAGDSSLLSFDDLGVESEEPDQEAEGAASAPAEEPPEGLSSSAFPDPWTPQRDGEDAESPMMESPMSEPSPPAPTPPPDTAAAPPQPAPGGEREDEEHHELTIDDLKKAPPEYTDLPGPLDEDDAGETEPPPERTSFHGLGDDDPFVTVPPEPSGSAPGGFDEVEAAADQIAGTHPEDENLAPGAADVENDLLADLRRPSTPRTVRVDPESLTGPTWEEPTSQALVTEPPPPRERGRNLPAALLSAAVLVVVALISLAFSKVVFAGVATAVVLLAQFELYTTMRKKGYTPATLLGLVMGALMMGAAYFRGESAMLSILLITVVATFLWYMAAPPKIRSAAVGNIAATLLGVTYVPMLAGYILVILAKAPSARATTLFVLGLTFLYDIAAFGVGTVWGSRALAPTISPKKSWEGVLGGTFASVAFCVAIIPSIEPYTLVQSVGIALIISIFAPLGDLAESVVKRDLGVKDMGSIMPGHGGMLDRIDSVLFVAPAVFYFLRLVL